MLLVMLLVMAMLAMLVILLLALLVVTPSRLLLQRLFGLRVGTRLLSQQQ
jgi:hypothetical protein